MGFEPVAVDTLVRRSGLTAETVSSILLLLELQGLVVSYGGGRYARVAKMI
jgi:DNA processing protein